jgi:putative membrane protein
MEAIVGLVIGILIAAVVSGVIIWLVSKFNVGLSVDGFGWAMLAGLFIGALTNLLNKLVPGMNEIVTMVIHLVIAAGVILLAGKLFSGVKVDGFKGALIAAVLIALVAYVLAVVLAGVLGGMGAMNSG